MKAFINQRTTLSFFVSLVFWALLTGSFLLAASMLLILFVHETGHYLAARRRNMDVTPPVFTPLGAVIAIGASRSAEDEAYMAIAGPLAGGLASLITVLIAFYFNLPTLLLAGFWGALINLFNMIPLSPLDGGRISMVLSRHAWVVGAPLLLLSLLFFGFNPINVLLFVLIGLASMADIRQRASQFDNDPSYFQVPAKVKYRYLAFYMALVLVLLVVILSVPSLASVMQAG